ncbi:MAG TPA: hypothetical protein VGC92_12925 [Phenylobacterium sp.]|jgi:hypothetical protein
MPDDTQENRQAGARLAPSDAEPGEVATGDRREDVHYEPDPDHLVKMKATFKPEGPLPPEEDSAASERGEGAFDSPPIQDVGVAKDTRSVWDARPPDDDQNHESGPGH